MKPAPLDPKSLMTHAEGLRRLARSLVFHDAQAEEVVQDTLLAALEHPPADRSNLGGWLRGVTRNVAGKARRSHSRVGRRERVAARNEATASTMDLLIDLEEKRRVIDCVEALREPFRTVVLKRYFLGLPPRQIAQVLERPLPTVKSQLARALAMLRKALDARHGGNRKAWIVALAPLARSPAAPAGILAKAGLLLGITFLVLGTAMGGRALWLAGTEDGGGMRRASIDSPRDLPGDHRGEEGPTSGPPLSGARQRAGTEETPAGERAQASTVARVPPKADLPAGVIAGIVVDQAGIPIAGRRVHISNGNRSLNLALVTDPAGRFRTSSSVRPELLPAHLYVSVGRDHVEPRPLKLTAARGDIRVQLSRGVLLEGRVWGPDGQPFGGAFVAVRDQADATGFRYGGPAGPSGRFRVRLPASLQLVSVWVYSGITTTDHGGGLLQHVRPGHDVVDLRLRPAASLAGSVADHRGRPVRGYVHLTPIRDEAHNQSGGWIAPQRPKPDGTFLYEHLSPAEYVVRFAPQETDVGVPDATRLTLPRDEPLRIVCPEPHVLTGRVVGRDVEGFEVRWLPPAVPGAAHPWHGVSERVGRTDEEGRFRVEGTRRGPGVLFARRDGDDRYAVVHFREDPLSVRLEDGQVIEGRIRDASGTFPEGFEFVAISHGIQARARLDPDGRFRFTGLPVGTFMLMARIGSGSSGQWGRVEAGTTDLDLVFRNPWPDARK